MLPPICSPFRRTGILSVRILFSNLTVSPMNHQLGMLVLRNGTRDTNCFSLSRGSYRSPGIACTFYLPATLRMWRHMLVLTHDNTSFQTSNAPAMRTLRRIGYRDNPFAATANIIRISDFQHLHLLCSIVRCNVCLFFPFRQQISYCIFPDSVVLCTCSIDISITPRCFCRHRRRRRNAWRLFSLYLRSI